jgi:hypothetical protein
MNIPPEVKVNGKWRPTRNSLGKLIHPTPEGLVAFWKWFGDSQVVDEQGRPLVVYHGTDSDWSVYDFSKKRKSNAGNPTGIYVTVRGEADAASYASTRVLSLYAKAERPYFLRGGNRINAAFITEYSKHLAAENSHIDSRWVGSKVEALRAEGKMPYTGMSSDAQRLVLLAGGFDSVQDGPHWAVLESTQIKSAIGNRGTFDPSDPVMTNPLVPLPPDFFPKAAENLRQQRAIRDDIYAKVGIWWDDLDAMMDELHRLHAEYKRRQFKVIKRNPRRRRRK